MKDNNEATTSTVMEVQTNVEEVDKLHQVDEIIVSSRSLHYQPLCKAKAVD